MKNHAKNLGHVGLGALKVDDGDAKYHNHKHQLKNLLFEINEEYPNSRKELKQV